MGQDHLLEGLSNETLVLAIWRINSLRRSLAIMALTWASCLHDPNTFAPRQAASLPAHTMARANSSNSIASAQVHTRACALTPVLPANAHSSTPLMGCRLWVQLRDCRRGFSCW